MRQYISGASAWISVTFSCRCKLGIWRMTIHFIEINYLNSQPCIQTFLWCVYRVFMDPSFEMGYISCHIASEKTSVVAEKWKILIRNKTPRAHNWKRDIWIWMESLLPIKLVIWLKCKCTAILCSHVVPCGSSKRSHPFNAPARKMETIGVSGCQFILRRLEALDWTQHS